MDDCKLKTFAIPAIPIDADLETLVDRIVAARSSTGSRPLPRALAWTTTPPTEPGLYWHSNARGRGIVLVIDLYAGHSDPALVAFLPGDEREHDRHDMGGSWYGPLVAPGMDGEVEL